MNDVDEKVIEAYLRMIFESTDDSRKYDFHIKNAVFHSVSKASNSNANEAGVFNSYNNGHFKDASNLLGLVDGIIGIINQKASEIENIIKN